MVAAHLWSQEHAPRHSVVLLTVVQLVRYSHALEVGQLGDGADREAPAGGTKKSTSKRRGTEEVMPLS